MSDSKLPDESGSESSRISSDYLRELRDRIAQSLFVMSIRESDRRDSDVIFAGCVQTRFGWTDIIAIRASVGAERRIGSVYIRTLFPTRSTPTDEWVARLQRSAVLMRYTRDEGGTGIEAQTRLPIFADRAISESIVSAVEPIIRLQGFMLVGSYGDRLRAQYAIWAMGPQALAGEQLQVVFAALRHALAPAGFRVVETNTGCVVIDDDLDVPSLEGCRVEVSTNFQHELSKSLVCAELVVPWGPDRGIGGSEAVSLLNRSDEASEDESLGVGAWYRNSEDGSLRYRILLPVTEQWTPCIDLFVSSLVIRWMDLESVGFAACPEFGLTDRLQALFSSLRSGDKSELRTEQFQGKRLSMDDYYRDMAARELVAQMAGISVTTVNRYIGPQPRRPREGRKYRRSKK